MKTDIRKDAVVITGESHKIDGVIKLSELALKTSIVITGYTETANAPNAGEFHPLYFYDAYGREVAGIIEFNSADNDKNISVSYSGTGSVMWADDYNNIKNLTQTLNDTKINKTSITDNLTTDDATKVLSAKQGKELKDDIGNQIYTEDNFVTDSESITNSIDALDMALNDTNETMRAYDLKNAKQYKWTLQMTVDGQPQIKFEEVI